MPFCSAAPELLTQGCPSRFRRRGAATRTGHRTQSVAQSVFSDPRSIEMHRVLLDQGLVQAATASGVGGASGALLNFAPPETRATGRPSALGAS
jgi:hypothetical protein